MRLLCHRGLWGRKSEQNTIEALIGAVNKGYGIETDIRDMNGALVVSHDPPVGDAVLTLEKLLEAYSAAKHGSLLALNVKADGLHAMLGEMLRSFEISNYFVFDMSLPDTLLYIKGAIPFAVRLSEYEDGAHLLDKAGTVWVDCFNGQWYSIDAVTRLLEGGKRVCIVSPELHARNHESLWQELGKIPIGLAKRLYLCTDLWAQAKEVFDVVTD